MYTHHCLLAFCPGLSSPFAYSGVVTYSYMQEGIHRYPCKSGYIFIYARGGRYPCKSGYIFIDARGGRYPCKSGYIIIHRRGNRQVRSIHVRVVTYSYILYKKGQISMQEWLHIHICKRGQISMQEWLHIYRCKRGQISMQEWLHNHTQKR